MCVCSVMPESFVTPWTVDHQAPLSMEFSMEEYQSGLPFPPPQDIFDPGIKPISPMSSALAGGFFTNYTTWESPDRMKMGKLLGTKHHQFSRSIIYCAAQNMVSLERKFHSSFFTSDLFTNSVGSNRKYVQNLNNHISLSYSNHHHLLPLSKYLCICL